MKTKKKFKIFRDYRFDIEKKLQYRPSRDGFSSSDFLSKCGKVWNTLSIVKSEHGNNFGGFFKEAWDSFSG